MEYRNGALVLQDNRLHCFHIDPQTVNRFPGLSEPMLVHLTPNNSGALRWSDERGQHELNVSDLRVPANAFNSTNAMLLIVPN